MFKEETTASTNPNAAVVASQIVANNIQMNTDDSSSVSTPGAASKGDNSGNGDYPHSVGSSPSPEGSNIQNKICHDERHASETKAIRNLKLLVFGSLLLSMIAVATATYFITAQSEQEIFVTGFEEDATKILSNVGQNLERTLAASNAFVAFLTAYAESTNQTWPFVVIPDFSVHAEKFRSLVGAVFVGTYPLVVTEQREEWEAFTAKKGPGMVDEAISTIAEYEAMDWPVSTNYTTWNVIFGYDEFEKENPGEEGVTYDGPYLPVWQIQPTIAEQLPPYNWDLASLSGVKGQRSFDISMADHKVVLGEPYLISEPNDEVGLREDYYDALWLSSFLPQVDSIDEVMQPFSDWHYPIIADNHKKIDWQNENYTLTEHSVVGILIVGIYWKDLLVDILPYGSNGIMVTFEGPCSPTFTYEVNGPETVFLGGGDLHENKYDDLAIGEYINNLRSAFDTYTGVPLHTSYCPMQLTIYPSTTLKASYTTATPIVFAVVTSCVFLLTVFAFTVYNYVVERRQKSLLKSAVTSNAIISSLFPETVKQQLIRKQLAKDDELFDEPKRRLKTFLNDGVKNDSTLDGENGIINAETDQIAELFPETTVMFADIAGFTAWSSTREPSAVFTLLEAIYGAFDKNARRMGIFKVETIGDSYVAVCGLPEPNNQHALKMAKFAASCLEEMQQVTSKLELSLGPGTADLALRLGLHSGPTIAGVLRGERARFQLFGDTVNTASRMESSSKPNRIQVSQSTADLIYEAGKGHWLTARADLVNAKGKGFLQTYWLSPRNSKTTPGSEIACAEFDLSEKEQIAENGSASHARNNFSASGTIIPNDKLQRLIDWNVELLEDLLKPIVHSRMKRGSQSSDTIIVPETSLVRAQLVPSIKMPKYQTGSTAPPSAPKDFQLDVEVRSQLRLYVSTVAKLYRNNNAFHNFEHASHVIMSTVKLLQRVATMDVKKKDCHDAKEYHDYTLGISNDPLTKFAIVFSALIHDLDHAGVSNKQLCVEEDPIAVTYCNKSPMEQHSFTLAMDLLMEDEFAKLRGSIYGTQDEFNRFYQLCINCVIATDIFDAELKALREDRWMKVFGESSMDDTCEEEIWHMRATIVIEYIIQASDVAHTMQHWFVYHKWNKKLFNEMYAAWKSGRAESDPSDGWYAGELCFFDNYVIPLAQKLRVCEVFGVDCDQLLDYAKQNRKEWEQKGENIVKSWKEGLENC